MSLLDLLAGLTAAGVRFIVVGGVAAAVHGSRRVTDDLDLLFDTAPDNLDRLSDLLAGWRACPRGIEPGLSFIMDAQTLRGTEVLTLATDRGLLDLMAFVKGVGTYAKALAATVVVELATGPVRVLSLPQLIAAKRAAARPRDREHLIELEALRELQPPGARER
jgi:predicted nucleotidyltransferase